MASVAPGPVPERAHKLQRAHGGCAAIGWLSKATQWREAEREWGNVDLDHPEQAAEGRTEKNTAPSARAVVKGSRGKGSRPSVAQPRSALLHDTQRSELDPRALGGRRLCAAPGPLGGPRYRTGIASSTRRLPSQGSWPVARQGLARSSASTPKPPDMLPMHPSSRGGSDGR
ncbi:hypothetical protein EK21DRAFT_90455 [Setomelanomma holmii]|uniref:Uncharacterized protein n=1 Tax=Setomelanomma holmii TaxID=210430 RepID=A0A9P4LKW5_9PLEO|nr:hypothetical protein EK21DRAFT_90455 [Setomelanomma holmii]